MTLNGRYELYCSKDASSRAHCEKLNEDRPILSAAKCGTMTVVFRSIKYMRIFAAVSRDGASNKWGGENKLFSSFLRPLLETGTRYDQSYY